MASKDARSRGAALSGLLLLASYLYGSLPFVYMLGARRNVDLRRTGSGNVGGSNLWAAAGIARGIVGWLGDASKGLVPVLAGRWLGCADGVAQLAGVCGVCGQCWPIFLRFNGGRGISAFVGASFAMNRRAWSLALLPMIGGSLWRVARLPLGAAPSQTELRDTRSKAVPLGCFLAVASFPVACASVPRRAPALLALVIVARRLTAPLPDDAVQGPSVRRAALLYRLLYDRNTSD